MNVRSVTAHSIKSFKVLSTVAGTVDKYDL